MTENRETFFARLSAPPASVLLTEDDIVRIETTYILAKYGHRAQERKEPDANGELVRYFEHPRRVALILMDEFGIYDPEMIMACLLHDCIEDTRDIDRRKIRLVCGAGVERMVALLSKVPKEGYLERLRTYACWRTLLVKGCDRLDNLRSLHLCDEAFQRKQIAETRGKYLDLFRRMIRMTPWEHEHRSRELYEKVEAVVVSYEKKFAGSDPGT